VLKYARPADYAEAVATTAMGPALMMLWERVAPSHVGRGGFASIMRLTGVISLGAGFLVLYQSSACELTKVNTKLLDMVLSASVTV